MPAPLATLTPDSFDNLRLGLGLLIVCLIGLFSVSPLLAVLYLRWQTGRPAPVAPEETPEEPTGE